MAAMTRDEKEISDLIVEMYAAMTFAEGQTPTWDGFRSAFRDGGTCVPAGRPAVTKPVAEFLAGMTQAVEARQLTSLDESQIGLRAMVFGNVAVAMSVFSAEVNGGTAGHGVNAFLLVRNEGRWAVQGVAWDNAGPGSPVPPEWLDD